nr:MAG TPA: hypothetical protein [Caudoviricetes sp.]
MITPSGISTRRHNQKAKLQRSAKELAFLCLATSRIQIVFPWLCGEDRFFLLTTDSTCQ